MSNKTKGVKTDPSPYSDHNLPIISFVLLTLGLSSLESRLEALLSLVKFPETEVEAAHIVQNLRGHLRLHFVLQDPGGCLVAFQTLLEVGLLKDLSQLNPGLYVIWVLLCYLLQMALEKKMTIFSKFIECL